MVCYNNIHPDLDMKSDSFVKGVLSMARKEVLGGADNPPQLTGFAAYHAVVDIERMRQDPEVAWLLEKPSFNLWSVIHRAIRRARLISCRLGHNRHVMSYVLGAGKVFNMVLSHPDNSDGKDWSQDQKKHLADMREEFKGWDPVYVKSPSDTAEY